MNGSQEVVFNVLSEHIDEMPKQGLRILIRVYYYLCDQIEHPGYYELRSHGRPSPSIPDDGMAVVV